MSIAFIITAILIMIIVSNNNSRTKGKAKTPSERSFRSTLRAPLFLNTPMEEELLRLLFERYWIRRIPNTSADSVQQNELVQSAIIAARDSDMIQVKTLLCKAVNENCTDVMFYQIIADVYFMKPVSEKYGMYNRDYFLVLNKLIELDPSSAQYLLGRADYCRYYQGYDEAIKNYRMLMERFPEDLWFPYILSKIYRKQNKKNKAAACLNHIVKKAPGIQIALMNKVTCGSEFETNSNLILTNDRVCVIAQMLLMNTVSSLPANVTV